MQKWIRPIRTLCIAALSTIVMYGGYALYAEAEFAFESPSLGFFLVKGMYHVDMNEYFNEKISDMIAMEMDDENYSPPVEGEVCNPKNVSAYCVAMGALDRYKAYVSTLDEISGYVDDSFAEGMARSDPDSLASLYTSTSIRDEAMEVEIVDALSVMEATIQAYNELKLAYPMHKKYEEVMVDLNNYMDFLADIRVQTEEFPIKFVDSTSQSCE